MRGISIKRVENKRRIRKLSRRRFKEWCEKQINRNVVDVVQEMQSEADSWN